MLPRLKRTYDGVLRLVEMFRRVLVLRIIAASDMSAFQTLAQMDPGVAHRETLLAARRAGLDFVDVIEMRAFGRHDFLLDATYGGAGGRTCRSYGWFPNCPYAAHACAVGREMSGAL
jgi:hypothetical protein